MSRALNIAGENITAATENHVRSVRQVYLRAAREALDSIDLATLPSSKQGVYQMLRQKLQAIDPISCPQFSALAGYDGVPLVGVSKWGLATASILLGTTAIALLGQPTFLHKAFSNQLEVQLWDTTDVVRNNLIAIGAVLAALLAWNRFTN
jgi:hypothetical protein